MPPDSSQQLEFSGEATESGSLVIRGCIIQAPGCIPQEFGFPVVLGDSKPLPSWSQDIPEYEERPKFSQLSARLQNLKKTSAESRPSSGTDQLNKGLDPSQFLRLHVVPLQPLLRIRRTSLTHGAVMLYSGET